MTKSDFTRERSGRRQVSKARTRSIMLDVRVEGTDLDAALDFYRKAFDRHDASQLADGSWKLRLGRVSIRVCSVPSRTDDRYRKGEVPRLELRVHDVDTYVDRCVKLGASVRCRLAKDRAAAENQAADYAQVLDPYGHLWSFANET